MKHFSIRVTGKVQGVFFRASTREEAQRLGLVGWVRNEADGSVWIEVEGDDDALDQLVAWCQHGPVQARVADVVVEEGEVEGYPNFQVQR
ncbi:MAG: acylphosphatase [Tunicatimonas sp.]